MQRGRKPAGSGALELVGLLLWGVALGIGVMGYDHIGRCIRLLASPGVPVEVPYLAEGGERKIRAEGFELDLAGSRARLRGVRLAEPGRAPIASARSVEVKWGRPALQVAVSGLSATLERGADGGFALGKALPKGKPGEKPPLLEATVDTAAVRWVDRYGGPPVEARLRLAGVRVSQGPDDLYARGTIGGPAGPRAEAAWQSASDGSWWAWVDTPAVEAAPLLPALARLAPAEDGFRLANLRAGSLVVRGEAEASQRAGGEVAVRLDAAFEAAGLSYPEWLERGRASGRVRGSLDAARASIRSEERGRSAEFDGWVGLSQALRAEGSARLAVSDDRRLWLPLRQALPSGLRLTAARFEGRVSAGPAGASAIGRVGAGLVSAQGQQIRGIRGEIGWDGRRLVLARVGGSWEGQRLAGSGSLDSQTGQVSAFVSASVLDLAQIGSRLGAPGLRGRGSASAVVSGTVRSPRVSVDARGDGSLRLPDGTRVPFQGLRARLASSPSGLQLEHAGARVAGGQLAASGRLPDSAKRGSVDFVAVDLELGKLFAGTMGRLSATGSLQGSLDRWRASGVAELLGFESGGFEVQAASGRFEAGPGKLKVAGAKAVVFGGLGELDGEIQTDVGALSGSAAVYGVPLSDLTGGRVFGLANVAGRFDGTLERPTVSATASIDRLYAGGLRAREVRGILSLADGVVTAREVGAQLASGRLGAHAEYEIASGTGIVRVEAEGARLEELLDSQAGISAAGTVGGAAAFRYDSSGIRSGTVELKLRELVVNDTPVGAGSLNASLAGGRVSGSASAGSVERYVSLEDVIYDTATNFAEANVDAYNIPLQDLVTATSRWSKDAADGLQALFRQSSGFATVGGRVSGPLDRLDIADGSLGVDALAVRGVPLGALEATFRRTEGAWRDVRLEWRDGGALLAASGDYDANGEILATVEASRVDLAKLRAVAPQFPLLDGRVESLTAEVTGTAEAPLATATLLATVEAFVDAAGSRIELPARAILDEIAIDRRRARVRGQANLRGFAGTLALHIPWSSFDPEDLAREPVDARLEFADRALSDLVELLPFLDPARTEGTASASILVGGFADGLALTGSARLEAERLGLNATPTEFESVALEVVLEPRRLVAKGGAKGVEGGSLALDATGRLDRPLWIGDALEATLERAVLSGGLQAEGLGVRHRADSAREDSRLLLDADLRLGGSIGLPELGGYAKATLTEAWLPEAFLEGSSQPLPDRLRFDDLRLLVSPGSRVRSAAVDLHLGGSGLLQGSLGNPRLALPLVIEHGLLRLPTAQIRLEPGGVVDVAANQGPQGPQIRTTVDIEGQTQVTARRFSGQYDLFDVVLTIRGDVLAPDRLTLLARSEPPELTQEEILSLLGRTDLIRALASATIGGSFDSGLLRETFYGLALPSLAENFLASVAEQLRVDFVRVDYNPFDLFSVVIGKTLGKGLLLQASRQLQQPGLERQKFDLRLVYRVPFGDRFVRRLRLGLGTNESVPWRVTLDWSTRF